jgi:site-specific DNA recombinase
MNDGNMLPASGNDRRLAALGAAETALLRPACKRAEPQAPRSTPIGFAYLRVSTKEQARTGGGAEGYSIPAQRDACLAKARQLGAVIEGEYIDAGESARSADRDDLQRMLRDIKTVKPDFVLVHKIDRLARNREDDIAINLLLRKHGVKLISCTENIDDTPSGRLLYGLMAEIAQFYSSNLAQEVMKGLVRKAEEGGTPFRAPLGYVNRRETHHGVERSWVELDPERAEIIRWCFEQYATGEWNGIDLTLAAQAKGLTTRPTPSKPGQPIPLNTMYHILSNVYYMGVVSYQGIHYEGKHPVLVEPDIWLAVQAVLAAHNQAGEKDRIHNHYLRGTIYCSACGGRLVYSQSRGNGGTYGYFQCVKKKTKANNCRRMGMRVEKIEEGIAQFYRQFRIEPTYAEQIGTAVRGELAGQQAEAKHGLERALKRKAQVQDERQKLLHAHYAGAVPQDLLATEMQRLTRALAGADAEIAAARTTNEGVVTTLAHALTAASHCQTAYLSAPDQIRKQINQGFFEKLLIGEDGSVEEAELTAPFEALLADGHVLQSDAVTQNAVTSPETTPDATDRALPSNVLRAMYGDRSVAETGPEHTMVGKVVLADHGVHESFLVDLLIAYSKRPDLLVDLRKVAEQLDQLAREGAAGERQSVRSVGKLGHVHGVRARLAKADIQEIILSFAEGTPRYQLAEKYGISLSSVGRLLRQERERRVSP